VLRRKLAESGIVISALVPLKTSALPYLPAAVQVAFWIVPVFPLPEESLTIDPAPSSNEYAATSSGTVASIVTFATFEYGPRLPAASVARTR
jgi:hypothetical protein